MKNEELKAFSEKFFLCLGCKKFSEYKDSLNSLDVYQHYINMGLPVGFSPKKHEKWLSTFVKNFRDTREDTPTKVEWWKNVWPNKSPRICKNCLGALEKLNQIDSMRLYRSWVQRYE